MSTGLHTLIVGSDGHQLTYQYMYRDGDSAPPIASFRSPFRRAELGAIACELSDLLAIASAKGGTSTEARLKRIGGQLCDATIPRELAVILDAAPSRSSLALYLAPELTSIPWELIHGGDNFWCHKFAVSRRILGPIATLEAAEKRLHGGRSGRGALILLGDTTNLRADSEKDALEQILEPAYGCNISSYADQPASSILEELKNDYEICHFIGHGGEDASGNLAWKCASGTVLSFDSIEAVSSGASFPLLVFANCCRSAETASPPETFWEVGALYQAFLKQGVPHYIGSISPIPDTLSQLFATNFYRSVTIGCSIAEALRSTRQRLYGKHSFPVWACYVHYGDPTHKLPSEASKRRRRSPIEGSISLDASQGRPAATVCVGRDQEITKAREQLAATRGRFGVMLITGETGTGKTTLLNRILDDAVALTARLVVAIAVGNQRFGTNEPYAIARQLVHSLLRNDTRIEIDRESIAVGEWLLAHIVTSFPQLAAVFRPDLALGKLRYDQFCESIGVASQTSLLITSDMQKADVIDQLVLLITRISKATPLVIAVDGSHWIDDSSAALIVSLTQASTVLNGTIILGYRSESRYASSGTPHRFIVDELRRANTAVLSLDFSTANEAALRRCESFVKACVDLKYANHMFPASFVKTLAAHTGANALFIIEVLQLAQDKGHIAKVGGSWQLAIDDSALELPESLSALMQHRIDELSDELKEMLTCASVEGDHFTAQVLAQLKGIDEEEIMDHLLDTLQRRHQIVEANGEQEIGPDKLISLFNFRNNLMRQHLYNDLNPLQKRRLHKEVGSCLESLYGDKREEVAPQLAAHYRLAREWSKALGYAIVAARRSAAVHANGEAIRFYRLALDMWEALGNKDIALKSDLLFDMAELLKATARYPESADTYERLLRLEGASVRVRGRAQNGLGDICRAKGEFQEALEHYIACEKAAVDDGDSLLHLEVWTDLAELYWSRCVELKSHGRLPEAKRAANFASEYANRVVCQGLALQAWENVRRGYVALGSVELANRAYGPAYEFFEKATALAMEYDLDRLSINNIGEIFRFAGQFVEARKHYEQYLEWSLRTGGIRQEIIARVNLGLTHLGRHEYNGARDSFNRVLDLNNPRRHPRASQIARAGIGVSFSLEGAGGAATEAYQESLRAAEIDPTDMTDCECPYRLARYLFGLGEWQLAKMLLEQSVVESAADAELRSMIDKCSSSAAFDVVRRQGGSI